MAKRFGLMPLLSEKSFLALKSRTVKAGENEPHEWSECEREEFEYLTKEWYGIHSRLTAEYVEETRNKDDASKG